ncbi:MAG: hypothetical protein JWR90_64 [Marmoricola sp.]|nr:hypothetical protein [Marmoricola sp.]
MKSKDLGSAWSLASTNSFLSIGSVLSHLSVGAVLADRGDDGKQDGAVIAGLSLAVVSLAGYLRLPSR